MFGHKRIPSREGGIEIVVEELASRMVEKGNSVTCFNRRGHHASGAEFDGEEQTSYKGIRIKSVWTVRKRGLAAASASFVAAIRTAFGRYDVVHIHAEGPAFLCWLPKWMGKRVIVTVHGLDHRRAKWGRLASAYIMKGEKNAVRYADEIIVLSRAVRSYFEEQYGRATRYIPNGVSKPVTHEAEEVWKRWGLRKDSYILYLGRIVPEKGIQYLLEAFQGVKTDKKLVIAGGSSDTAAFMKMLRGLAEKDERILFTDFVEGQVLDELFTNAYLYVLPSDLEGMPLSLLEAMSYGNCCLISDIPECTEVAEDRAVIFEKGRVGDLRKKLQTLCDSPQTVRRYKDEAQTYILNKYNWDRVTEETLRLYRGS